MRFTAAVLTISLVLAGVANAADIGTLEPGAAVGVQKAQAETSMLVLAGLGAGLTGLAIAAIASNGKAGGCASGNPHTPCGSTTTTTTTTTAT